ncbi:MULTISPECIES: phage replisome organizer N-terminal domain-containing protein [Weissella]|uniref:DnaD domain protein n=1 Tax=Weissella thailandensis TaxID=89061 RepID=A0ABX9IAC1_9LACO|nr:MULTISPECIES: phage replisome organizer N-terminal domain-containing protein [Weissella]NKY90327.1 DnaD domain protein [Weissella thailandensis]RDS60444.1 DnaD domain protein [Weissella thailandensis]GEP75619.1 replisome organizer [Weissella thailandensis]
MANKKFFWIKLKQDFFNDPYIKLLRRMAGGDTYTIIYLEMLVKSASTNGMIYFQGAGRDIAEELSLILDENVEDVRALLAYLEAKKLITHPEIKEDMFLVASADLTGSETDSAMRMRKFRERQTLHSNGKTSLSYAGVTDRYDKEEEELDKELDIEQEVDRELEKEKEPVKHLPAISERNQLAQTIDKTGFSLVLSPNQIENLYAYFEDDGLEIGVVIMALEEASDLGKRNYKYVRAILENKLKNGIDTVGKWQAEKRDYNERKSNNQVPKNSEAEEWAKEMEAHWRGEL